MAAHFARIGSDAVPKPRNISHPCIKARMSRTSQTGDIRPEHDFGQPAESHAVSGRSEALTPEYRDGTKATGNWREAFAAKLTADPLFGINFANRIWKEFFGLALIDPVDTIDPDRLDPQSAGGAMDACRRRILSCLQQFGQVLRRQRHESAGMHQDDRAVIRYQLSSRLRRRMEGSTTFRLFARHYPRRMWAEEVHDAIVQATGVMPHIQLAAGQRRYVDLQGTPANQLPKSEPVNWAMKLPDITEPRYNNGTTFNGAINFMNSFNRGNRDTARRAPPGRSCSS